MAWIWWMAHLCWNIKPYVLEFEVDDMDKIRIGWLERRVHRLKETRDDGRFVGE